MTMESSTKYDWSEVAKKDLQSFFSLADADLSVGEWREKGRQGLQPHGQENLRISPGNVRIELRLPRVGTTHAHPSLKLSFRLGLHDRYLRRFISEYGWALEDLASMAESRFTDAARSRLIEEAVVGTLTYRLDPDGASYEAVRSSLKHLVAALRGRVSQTYEGQRMGLNIAVSKPDFGSTSTFPLFEFLEQPWSPALGSSPTTALEVEWNDVAEASSEELSTLKSGRPSTHQLVVQKVVSLDARSSAELKEEYAPLQALPLAKWSDRDKKFGLVITREGELGALVGGEVICAHRQGRWKGFPIRALRHGGWSARAAGAPRPNYDTQTKIAVIESLLDASFQRQGGSVAIISRQAEDHFLDWVKAQSLESERPVPYWSTELLRDIVGQGDRRARLFAYSDGDTSVQSMKFQDLSRAQRLEMLSMDGATILDRTGVILAIGAIVPLDGEANVGGRAAAAASLARFGVAFKVSQDGPVTMYAATKKPVAYGDLGSEEVLKFG